MALRQSTRSETLQVLCLDGGGSKGVYSIGVLKEVEARLGGVLADHFGLIYGTSTGAIIGALVSLGTPVAEIEKIYFEIIPRVMRHRTRSARSMALREEAQNQFGTKTFGDFETFIGIVATNYEFERPLVFKNCVQQAFGRQGTFVPGYGCTITDALLASTAAFPFFERVKISTANQGSPEVFDGGFCANNPTLFAIADATQTLGYQRNAIRVLSVGVGHYNEPQRTWYSEIVMNMWPFEVIRKQLAINSNTVETMRRLFFSDVVGLRIDDSFPDRRYATDLLEADPERLRELFVLGRESFARQEPELLRNFL